MNTNLKSADVIIFTPNGDLVVGDSIQAELVSFQMISQHKLSTQNVNFFNIDSNIAKHLGVPSNGFHINDFALHPTSREAVIAVTRGSGSEVTTHILAIGDNTTVYEPKLEKIGSFAIPNPVDAGTKSKYGVALRQFSITTISHHEGHLFVAGLSNAEFSSALHKIPYPFPAAGTHVTTCTTEIYHAVHRLNETRAPIRAQTILNAGEDSVLVAAYTCTPVVLINLKDMKDKNVVKGKTIGDVGYGNTPIDVIQYKAWNDSNKKVEDYVMITNKHRTPNVISKDAILSAEEFTGAAGNLPCGICAKAQPVPLQGVYKIADYNDQYFLAFRRDLTNGWFDLITINKAVNFRLTDHTAEFEMPSFVYSEKLQGMKNFQIGMLNAEGLQVNF